MLKQKVEFKDFDGKKQTEYVYLHMTKPEVLKFMAAHGVDIGSDNIEESFNQVLEGYKKTKNILGMLQFVEDMLLSAYGKRSEEGNRFIKSDEVRQEFVDSLAYEALFNDVVDNPKVAEKIASGIIG